MGDALLVNFRRQAVIAFIAGHERLQGAALNKVLHRIKLRIITGIFSDIGDVNVIKGGEVVKVEDMVLDDMCAVDKVADESTIIRDFIRDAESAIQV